MDGRDVDLPSPETYRDRISELPDDVLSLILSRLELKEAARTSILSKRWISALNLFSGALVFNTYLLGPISPQDSPPARQHRFVSLVNWFLFTPICRSPIFQRLVIHFRWVFVSASDLDNWFLFAFRKNVQMLDINLSHSPGPHCCPPYWEYNPECYIFPLDLFSHSTFTSLRDLRLSRVEVSQEAFNWLLTRCPNLESLSVTNIKELVSLRISVPSLRLAHFELDCTFCHHMIDLEISPGSLMSLLISAPPKSIRFSLENGPHLVEASFMGFSGIDKYYPIHFASNLTNLESLKLAIFLFDSSCGPTRELEKVREENSYQELKEVTINGFNGCVRIREFVIYLVENALSLEKIVVDACLPYVSEDYRDTLDYKVNRQRALQFKSQLPRTLNYIVM